MLFSSQYHPIDTIEFSVGSHNCLATHTKTYYKIARRPGRSSVSPPCSFDIAEVITSVSQNPAEVCQEQHRSISASQPQQTALPSKSHVYVLNIPSIPFLRRIRAPQQERTQKRDRYSDVLDAILAFQI